MISNRPTVPLLVHEDCMEGVQLDLAKQQESLSKISANASSSDARLMTIVEQQQSSLNFLQGFEFDIGAIASNTNSIKNSSSNTATQLGTIKEDTGSLMSSVGLPADEATASTVIGLLKSISNKL